MRPAPARSAHQTARAPPAQAWRAAATLAALFGLLVAAHVADALPFPASGAGLHPLWAPVIFAAAVYGPAFGVGAVVVATVLSFALSDAVASPALDYYASHRLAWREPILWLATALFLGELRRRWGDERDAWRAAAEQAGAERSLIADQAERLRARIGALEHQILTQTAHGEMLVDAMARLQAAQPGDLRHVAADCLAGLLDASLVQAVHRGPDGWVVAAQAQGPAAREALVSASRLLAPPAALDAIAAQGRILVAFDRRHAQLLRGVAAALPVAARDGGRVDDLLLVRDLDFDAYLRLGAPTLAHLVLSVEARLEPPTARAARRPRGRSREWMREAAQ
ncbi:MAG TPA: hypothetical protein VIL72_10300 [Beijerinckiaceae bacterium]